jgi:hypothetical protein
MLVRKGFLVEVSLASERFQGIFPQANWVTLSLLRKLDDFLGDDLGGRVGAVGEAKRAQRILESGPENRDVVGRERRTMEKTPDWHLPLSRPQAPPNF